MSSLSSSPTPSYTNSASNLTNQGSSQQQQQQQTPTNKPKPDQQQQQAYANSKSILFGIPRDYAPMPTIPAENYHHPQIDSPFVDVTLNNCDDMSLYKPMKNLQINNNRSGNNLSPLVEPSKPQSQPQETPITPSPINNFTSNNNKQISTNELSPSTSSTTINSHNLVPKPSLTSVSTPCLNTNYTFPNNGSKKVHEPHMNKEG